MQTNHTQPLHERIYHLVKDEREFTKQGLVQTLEVADDAIFGTAFTKALELGWTRGKFAMKALGSGGRYVILRGDEAAAYMLAQGRTRKNRAKKAIMRSGVAALAGQAIASSHALRSALERSTDRFEMMAHDINHVERKRSF